MNTKIEQIIATYTNKNIQALTEMDAGLESSVFRVLLDDGSSIIVKSPKPGRSPNYILEADAYRKAKAIGMSVPEILRADAGSLIMSVMPGEELDDKEDLYTNNALFQRIAEDMAWCWKIEYDGFGPIDLDGYQKTGKISGKYAAWDQFISELDSLLQSPTLAAQLEPDVLEKLKKYWGDHKASAYIEQGRLVHGDFAMSAIFVKESKYSGIIDFGDALIGDPLMDLAYFRFKEINKEYGPMIYDNLSEPYSKLVGPGLLNNYDERINLYMIWWGVRRVVDCPDQSLTPKFAAKLACVAQML